MPTVTNHVKHTKLIDREVKKPKP